MDCDEESVHCPKGSTIAKLEAASGTTDLKGPYVKRGFFSELDVLEQILSLVTCNIDSHYTSHIVIYIFACYNYKLCYLFSDVVQLIVQIKERQSRSTS